MKIMECGSCEKQIADFTMNELDLIPIDAGSEAAIETADLYPEFEAISKVTNQEVLECLETATVLASASFMFDCDSQKTRAYYGKSCLSNEYGILCIIERGDYSREEDEWDDLFSLLDDPVTAELAFYSFSNEVCLEYTSEKEKYHD